MLDPRTGEVLALASTPTYDASRIANPATADDGLRRRSATTRRQPLLTRATQGRYVPGSVFKIVTAIAGPRRRGRSHPTRRSSSSRRPRRTGSSSNGFRIREHAGVPAGAFDLTEATEWSSNIWYALAGLRTGGEQLATYGRRAWGSARRIPFDLPTAVSQVTNGDGNGPGGFRTMSSWRTASYGQAETLVTPLQMALVASTVANDGVLMRPRLVTRADAATTAARGRSARRSCAGCLRRATRRRSRRRCRRRSRADIGRQFTSGAKVPGVPTAGKSGTAELGGTGEPHSWFIGFAPADEPRSRSPCSSSGAAAVASARHPSRAR